MQKNPMHTVLIVDDDPLNARILETFLSDDYITCVAGTGEEALDIISSNNVDIVLLDIMMPGVDGYEVCRRIKSTRSTQFIKVIMITALSTRDDRLLGLEVGADEFLVKPVDRLEVIIRVRALLKSKEMYDEMATERDRSQTYFDISGCIMVALNNDGTVKLVNRKCCEVLGYEESELLGRNWFEMIILPDDRDMVSSVFSNIIKGNIEEVTDFENSVLTKNGEKRIIRWNNSYVKDADGNITGTLSSGSDVTGERRMMIKLQASEKKFRSLFENAADAILIFDLDCNIIDANSVSCEMLGYDVDELLGMSRHNLISSEEEGSCADRLADVMDEKSGSFEMVYLKKDGTRIPVEMGVRMIEYNGSNALLCNARDISERKNAEADLSQYAKELARKNEELKTLERMKDEFISNLSHEIKTPLISIKGYSELVHDEALGTLNIRQKKALKTVLDKYDQLSFLMDSLIYMSIVKSGKVHYRLDPTRIVDSLNKVMDYFKVRSQDKALMLLMDIEDDLPLVKGDVEYMPYLFRAIIDNAIKFSEEGSKVIIRAFKDEGNVHITVKDFGIGIPENEIPNIFRRFYQIDGSMSRRYGGSGLGLYVSKTITEIHNGEIWIESDEGKGTTVHVRFPVYRS